MVAHQRQLAHFLILLFAVYWKGTQTLLRW